MKLAWRALVAGLVVPALLSAGVAPVLHAHEADADHPRTGSGLNRGFSLGGRDRAGLDELVHGFVRGRLCPLLFDGYMERRPVFLD